MNLTDPDIRQYDGVRVHLRPVHADDRERLGNLVNRARARGVCYLRCHLLPGNNKARGLLNKVSSLTDSTMIIDEDGVLLELAA